MFSQGKRALGMERMYVGLQHLAPRNMDSANCSMNITLPERRLEGQPFWRVFFICSHGITNINTSFLLSPLGVAGAIEKLYTSFFRIILLLEDCVRWLRVLFLKLNGEPQRLTCFINKFLMKTII